MNIPTAEEMECSGLFDSYQTMMIRFAEMHVTAALKAASENAKIEPNYSSKYDDPEDRRHTIDKESILSAYPLSNIK